MTERKARNLFAWLIVLAVAMSLVSCDATKRAQRRVNRIVKKHPELLQHDTVTIHDTVIIESYSVDTVTRIESHDTVEVINNERVLLKYFYDTLQREIWHHVECKQDTIYRTHTIPVEKIKAVTSTKIPFYYWIILAGLLVLSFLAILRRS